MFLLAGGLDSKGRKDSRDGLDDDDDVFHPRRGSSADGKYNRSGTDDPSKRKGSGGSLGDSAPGSRKSSSGLSSGAGSRKASEETPFGRNLGSRQGSRDFLGPDGSQLGSGPNSRKSSALDDDNAAGTFFKVTFFWFKGLLKLAK